jgi:hypothetical protein
MLAPYYVLAQTKDEETAGLGIACGGNHVKRTSAVTALQRPDLDQIAHDLIPVLETGLPISDQEADQVTNGLGKSLHWPEDGVTRGKYANDQLRSALQNFADKSLAAAALKLFGEDKDSSSSLETRRECAAEAVQIPSQRFAVETEPQILRIMAWQLSDMRWPDDGSPLREDREHHFPRRVIPAMILLAVSATTGWLQRYTDSSIEAIIRLGCLIAAMLVAGWPIVYAGLKRIMKRPASSNASPAYLNGGTPPDPKVLHTYLREAAQRLERSRIATPLLVDMLLAPASYRARTVETISLEGQSIKQHVSIDFSFSDVNDLLAAESERLSAESKKLAANSERLYAESQKLAAESEKLAAESERLSADSDRLPTDFERLSAESERLSAESKRLTAESERLYADSERLSAESERSPDRLSLYVPILVPQKGELIDRLQIRRSDGSAAASLSYSQTLRVLSLGLHYLLVSGLAGPKTEAEAFNDPEFVKAELALLQIIARRGPRRRDSVENAVNSTIDELKKRFKIHNTTDNPARSGLEQARRYVLHLSERYPIIVSLPYSPQPRRRLEYERTIPPKPVVSGVPAKVRLWVGLRPHVVRVPITLAAQTDSYHLQIVGPLDHYVHTQFLGCMKCSQRIMPRWRKVEEKSGASKCDHAPVGTDDRFYDRVRYRAGQNYAHLYMRDFYATNLQSSNIQMRVKFSESPPGVEEQALLASAAVTVALSVIGYVLERSSSQIPSDAPVLFLALPGFAATWFGFTSDSDTILRSSLVARLSLLITGFLSLAGLAVYLLETEHLATSWPRATWGILGVHDRAWMALLGIALLNTLGIAWTSAARIHHFVRVASKPRLSLD